MSRWCGRSERPTAHQADLVCLARRIVSTSAACSLRMVAIGVQSSSSIPSPGALRKRSRHSRRKRNSEGCGEPARSKVSSRYAVGYKAYGGEASSTLSRIASARTCRPSPEPPPLAAASASAAAGAGAGGRPSADSVVGAVKCARPVSVFQFHSRAGLPR